MCIWTPLVLGVRGDDVTDASEQSLLVVAAGTSKVETKALTESPGRGRVVLGASLHLVELHHHVPGVQDPSAGLASLPA